MCSTQSFPIFFSFFPPNHAHIHPHFFIEEGASFAWCSFFSYILFLDLLLLGEINTLEKYKVRGNCNIFEKVKARYTRQARLLVYVISTSRAWLLWLLSGSNS